MHRLERLALAKAYIALTRVMVDTVFGEKPADHSPLLIGSAIMVGHRRMMERSCIATCAGIDGYRFAPPILRSVRFPGSRLPI
jgi:hypothetical protein